MLSIRDMWIGAFIWLQVRVLNASKVWRLNHFLIDVPSHSLRVIDFHSNVI